MILRQRHLAWLCSTFASAAAVTHKEKRFTFTLFLDFQNHPPVAFCPQLGSEQHILADVHILGLDLRE